MWVRPILRRDKIIYGYKLIELYGNDAGGEDRLSYEPIDTCHRFPVWYNIVLVF